MSQQNPLPFKRKPQPALEIPGESVEGVLERITFQNEDNGWSVVRLRTTEGNQLVTAVGILPGVKEGEHLRLIGKWVTDRKYGRQFKTESFLPVNPSTLAGIERYLGSGMVPGIGKEMARRLVESFGIETLEVIESEPWRLNEVDGIGPKRTEQIVKAWKDQRAIKDVMVFLQTHGVTPGYAMKIFKKYGDRAVHLVQKNPYRLAIDITGIGFKIADKIAMKLGVEKDSPQRAEAGVMHTLSELADKGHVYAPADSLVEAATGMLGIDTVIVEAALQRLGEQGQVHIEPVPDHVDHAVYLNHLHYAETEAASRLKEIAEGPLMTLDINVPAALEWFENDAGIRLAERQADAITRAVSSKLLVITGGPGTGKTTIVNAIIRILKKKDRKILLCAPTGRAAKRMQEATGEDAKTIHRLLEFNPQTMSFARDQETPLEADLIVVDEVSMVDTMLLHFLAAAVPPTAQLVLVGDIDQLPSVGPGSVLRDIIASGAADVVALNEIFRQASASQIVVNAHRVNQGQLPVSGTAEDDSDFFFIEREDPEDVLETIKSLVSHRIPQRFGLDPFTQVQVLTPMHRGILGATNLNAELQALLNPKGDTLTRGNRTFRVGDKVMQIRNNYELDVYNGDLGVVKSIEAEARKMTVTFERDVSYEQAELDELVTAYACSIHKSQGSEYPCVVIPIHTQHYVMLQRNLLYTAITRGRELVILVGNKRALAISVRNNHVADRYTRLAQRLHDA